MPLAVWKMLKLEVLILFHSVFIDFENQQMLELVLMLTRPSWVAPALRSWVEQLRSSGRSRVAPRRNQKCISPPKPWLYIAGKVIHQWVMFASKTSKLCQLVNWTSIRVGFARSHMIFTCFRQRQGGDSVTIKKSPTLLFNTVCQLLIVTNSY